MWDHEIGALKAPINCTAIFQPLVNFGPAIVYTLRIGIFVHLCRVCISMYSVSQLVYKLCTGVGLGGGGAAGLGGLGMMSILGGFHI